MTTITHLILHREFCTVCRPDFPCSKAYALIFAAYEAGDVVEDLSAEMPDGPLQCPVFAGDMVGCESPYAGANPTRRPSVSAEFLEDKRSAYVDKP